MSSRTPKRLSPERPRNLQGHGKDWFAAAERLMAGRPVMRPWEVVARLSFLRSSMLGVPGRPEMSSVRDTPCALLGAR